MVFLLDIQQVAGSTIRQSASSQGVPGQEGRLANKSLHFQESINLLDQRYIINISFLVSSVTRHLAQ